MNKFITLLLLLTGYVSNAQIEIIEKPITEISVLKILGLTMESLNKDTVNDFYFVTYRDASNLDNSIKERPLKTFKIGSKESVIELREIMLNILSKKEKDVTIKMEGTLLRFIRNGSSFYTLLTYQDGTSGYMTVLNKSKVKKLFPLDKL